MFTCLLGVLVLLVWLVGWLFVCYSLLTSLLFPVPPPFLLCLYIHLTKHSSVCLVGCLIDSNSTVDKVGGGDERTQSMSSASSTTSWGGWESSPTPSLDNGNWNKNPQEFFGIFESLTDRCAFVVWAVSNSRNRVNWRLTSVSQVHNVLAIIAKFAKQPANDVYFLRQTHRSK